MGMKAGKIWGQTELIHANGVLEFSELNIKKEAICSEHDTNTNGMDSLLSLERCLYVFGKTEI